MLLIGYMLVSCLLTIEPFISFKRWTRGGLIPIVMAFIVATESDPRKALESLFRRTIYILIPFSYILIHYFPEYGRIYVHRQGLLMWTGVALHKNSLAQFCLFAAFFLVWTFIRRRQGRNISVTIYQTYLEVFILLLTFWIVGGPEHRITYSATSTATFAVGLLVFIGLSLKKKRGNIPGPKILMALILFIFIYGTVTPMFGKLTLIDISSTFGREETLTGRAGVWEQLVPVAMTRPILGFGFGGFWTTENRGVHDISDAHNGYLGVILELGFFGLLLYAIFLLFIIRKVHRVMTQNFNWGALWVCFLLMVLVHNITESLLNSFTSCLMAVIIFLSVSYSAPTSYTQGASRKS